MIVETHRFGPLNVPDNQVVTFKRPILGFEHLSSFCLVEREDVSPFLWLQSTESPDVAFLVVNPVVFFPDYRIEVNPREIAELKIKQLTAVETYVIVTVPSEPSETSVNLQGPLLINSENGRAKQLVLVNSRYGIKHRLINAIDKLNPAAEEELSPVAV